MISLVVHAGMKVASIAEKFMYIVQLHNNPRQIRIVESLIYSSMFPKFLGPLLRTPYILIG